MKKLFLLTILGLMPLTTECAATGKKPLKKASQKSSHKQSTIQEIDNALQALSLFASIHADVEDNKAVFKPLFKLWSDLPEKAQKELETYYPEKLRQDVLSEPPAKK